MYLTRALNAHPAGLTARELARATGASYTSILLCTTRMLTVCEDDLGRLQLVRHAERALVAERVTFDYQPRFYPI